MQTYDDLSKDVSLETVLNIKDWEELNRRCTLGVVTFWPLSCKASIYICNIDTCTIWTRGALCCSLLIQA